MSSQRRPGRLGLPWLSTDWLAHEMVTAERQAQESEWEDPDLSYMLWQYRDVIATTRSSLMRGLWVPDLERCWVCKRLIDHDLLRRGARCPYCRVNLIEEAPGYERRGA